MADAPAFDPSTMKLGRVRLPPDRRSLKLSSYLDYAKLPTAPTAQDWSGKVASWPMFKNDLVGDCVEAAIFHLLELWTAWTNGEIALTDQEVIALYTALTGYNPSDPNTDQGTNMLSALNYWRKTGVQGHTIGAFVQVDLANDLEVLYALWLFGGLFVGVNMPLSAQSQPALWDVPQGGAVGNGAPGSWGGHCITVISYPDPQLSTLGLITWGQKIAMTKAFWRTYTEECWAVLSSDWANGTKQAPSGFAYQDLLSDLQAITSGPLPIPQPPAPPQPTPVQHFVPSGPAAPAWQWLLAGNSAQALLDPPATPGGGGGWGDWFHAKGCA